MVPVGGIQLVPAGLAAYSTFVPIQAGPVQLTIPAVSVIHRQANSPLSGLNTPSQPEGSPGQPMIVQEPVSNVLPCFPLGQVAGLQTLSTPQATLQPVGVETLSVVGLANSAQLMQQQSLALNVGVQVLAASPTPQSSTASSGHIPSLQILNIALPALIPSLSPLSALSPIPLKTDKPCSPEGIASVSLPSQAPESLPTSSPASTFPTGWPTAATPVAVVPIAMKPLVEPMRSPNKPSGSGDDKGLRTAGIDKAKSTQQPQPLSAKGVLEGTQKGSSMVAGKAKLPQQHKTKQQVTDDFNDASSDDEDRLVIAT